jgi:hypothetical protein
MLELVNDRESTYRPGEIIRAEHDKDHPFLQVDKRLIRDKKLGFELRGFLCFILAQPTDWHSRIDVLARDAGIPKSTCYKYVGKLTDAGYIKRDIIKRRDGAGRFQSTVFYTVYESPKAATAEKIPYRQIWKHAGAGVATACRVIQTPVRSVCGGQRAHVAPSGVLGVFQAYPPRVHCQPRRLAPRR